MNRQTAPKRLTKKEKLFCLHYAVGGNAREAAVRAGYPLFPERTGNALLEREEIRTMVAELQRRRAQEDRLARVRAGYERLAFGSVADAVRLFLSDGASPAALEEMDLFSVSEIKRPREGAMEIKFYDRLEALDRLRGCDGLHGREASPFYRAREKGVEALESVSDRAGEEVS